jgi:hypothetical protein
MIDIAAERDLVLEQIGPNQSRNRPGVTREQAARFHKRREAWEQAQRPLYRNGSSIAQVFDPLLRQGATLLQRGPRLYLACPDETLVPVTTSAERAYVQAWLNTGALARNY